MTAIEWTDATWNPVVGCTPVSAGCLNCYAATMARRLEAMGRPEYLPRVDDWAEARPGEGALELEARTGNAPRIVRIAEVKSGRAVFTGEVRTVPGRLTDPMHWRKPRRVFVNSMSDLFHEAVPFDYVDRVFAVMALCPQHTFQILTKRPERMAEYLNSKASPLDKDRWDIIAEIAAHTGKIVWDPRGSDPVNYYGVAGGTRGKDFSNRRPAPAWPLPNVWLGTSVENQAAADERIPHLLKCPAAVRFLSCEPLLGPVKLRPQTGPADLLKMANGLIGPVCNGVDWVIVGGESGPHARPCDVAWIRSIVGQCRAAGVPVFVKQLGARVHCRNDEVAEWLDQCGLGLDWIDTDRVGIQGDPVRVMLTKKGGTIAEWPEDLRVREMPGEKRTAHSTQHTAGDAGGRGPAPQPAPQVKDGGGA